MARTITAIYDELIAEKEQYTSLNAYTPVGSATASDLMTAFSTGSKVALWRLYLWLFAFGTYVLELIYDRHVTQIEEIVARTRVGTLSWYVAEAKKYQAGDTLTLDSAGFYVYDPVDESARLVSQAAASAASGIVYVKVAKDGSSDLEPLTTLELAQFQAYVDDIAPAGIIVQAQSFTADLLAYSLSVIHDGLRAPGDIRTDVIAAVDAYIRALPFDGTFYVQSLVDAVQVVPGVLSIGVIDITITPSLSAIWQYSVQPDPARQSYRTLAGYMRVDDPATDVTLTLSIG